MDTVFVTCDRIFMLSSKTRHYIANNLMAITSKRGNNFLISDVLCNLIPIQFIFVIWLYTKHLFELSSVNIERIAFPCVKTSSNGHAVTITVMATNLFLRHCWRLLKRTNRFKNGRPAVIESAKLFIRAAVVIFRVYNTIGNMKR